MGAVVLSLASWLFPYLGAFQSLERTLLDTRYRLVNRTRPASDRVVMLDIDDQSLKLLGPYYGRWPWPRRFYKDVLEFISLGEPAGVYFDILFSEPMLGTRDDEQLARISADLGYVSHAMNFLEAPSLDIERFALPDGFEDRFSLSWDGPAPPAWEEREFKDYAVSLPRHLPLLPRIFLP